MKKLVQIKIFKLNFIFMKTLFIAALIAILSLSGCARSATDFEDRLTKQMQEAETLFEQKFSGKDKWFVYPNRIVIGSDGKAETWPVFFNKNDKNVSVQLKVSCNNTVKLDFQDGVFIVEPNTSLPFAVTIEPTKVVDETYLCRADIIVDNKNKFSEWFVAVVE